MANIGSVVIQFLAENKMGRTLSEVKKGLSGVDSESGKAKKTFGRLSAAWAAAIPIAGAVVGAGIGLANVLIDASKAALEDKNSSAKLAGVLSKIPGVTDKAIAANEDWISSMELATLVSDTDLRAAVGKLTLATGDLTKAQELTKIAVDASTVSGKNLSSVTDAMAKAASGNTSQLKRMFPWLDANKDGTLTYAEAVKGLGEKYKGASKEASKTKPWEVLQTIWGQIQEALGQFLMPLLETFGDWFSDDKNKDGISDFSQTVGNLAHDLGVKLVEAVRKIIWWLKKPENQQKIRDWIKMMRDFARFVGAVISGIQTLIGWMNRIPAPGAALRKLVDLMPGGNAATHGMSATATAATTTAATTTPPPAPVVMVTEEQIARAIQRVLMRSDARNGRLTRIA